MKIKGEALFSQFIDITRLKDLEVVLKFTKYMKKYAKTKKMVYRTIIVLKIKG